MTEALDIQKARHSEISPTKREQKRWHRKDILTPALSAAAGISWTSSFFKLQSLQVKLQSCFIWNSPTYSAERHSDKSACTFHRNRSEVYSSKRKLLVAFQTFRCRPRPALERWGWGGGGQKHRCPWGGERWIWRRVCLCPWSSASPISDDPLVGIKGEGVGGSVTIGFVTMPDLFRITFHDWRQTQQ